MQKALKQQRFTSTSGITELVTDYKGKLQKLANFEHLVSAKWVDQLINHKQPLYAPQHGYKIVEVEWGPPSTYLLSHIPSSLYVNTNDIERKPWWNKVSNTDLKKVINDLGIRYNTTVIVYARNNMSAARFANFLMYAGVQDVRLLNGGWNAWVNAGYPTQAFINENHDDVSFGKSIPANPQYLTDLQQAKALLQQPRDSHHSSVSELGKSISATLVVMITSNLKAELKGRNGVMQVLVLTTWKTSITQMAR